jgi:ABC-2 type transport system permease protein
MEARLTARRGENLLAMIVIPAVALAFVATVGPGGRGPDAPLAAALALAIVASGLVNLGIATAYERAYGVLKRLGGAPLGRDGLVAAKLVVVGLIAIAQVVALVALAFVVLGWRAGASASIVAVLITTLVGAATFATVGLLLAGSLRPEATLVVANALFLVALLVGGLVVPIEALPEPLASLAGLLPFGALSAAFDAALGGDGQLLRPLAIVAAWGVAASLATVRLFRWE